MGVIYLFLLSVSMQGQWSPLRASWELAMGGGSPLEDQPEKPWFIFPRVLVIWVTGTESLSSWLAGGQKLRPVVHHWDSPSRAMTSQNPARARVCQRDCNTALSGGIVGGHQLSSLPVSRSHRHAQEAWKTQSSPAGDPEVLRPP